jgi:hypothetical protein
MDGTIALWFEPNDTAQPAPKLSLHINVWKDVSKTYNFLDIGFRLSDAENLKRFFLFFPADLRSGAVSDLSRVLKFGKVLHAVFNDVVEVTDSEETCFRTEIDGVPFLMVHHLDLERDVSIQPVLMASDRTGSTVMFTDDLCSRIRARADIDHYVRIRLKLTEHLDELFSSEMRSGDWRFASAANDLELTEIRLNERRSFPSEITRASRDRFFTIKSIHYFLVRHVENQLVLQYPEARKVRRLEPALWGPYLSDQPAIEPKRLNRVIGKLMIYHWRGLAPPPPSQETKLFAKRRRVEEPGIDDFIVFASFRRAQPNHFIYAVAIVILGAMGSALCEVLKAPLGEGTRTPVAILALLFAMLLLLYAGTVQPLRNMLSKIRRWAASLRQ